MKIAFIGDSLVSCTNVRFNEAWPGLAAEKAGFTAINNAGGGKLTLVMWGMFQMDVVNEGAEGVFIQCGMNDILLDDPLSKVKENISGTLDKAEKAGLSMIILGKPPFTKPESVDAGWQLGSELKKHNEALKEYRDWLDEEAARRNIPVLDFQAVLEAGEAATGRTLQADGLHFTPEGYALVADAFVDLLKKEFPDKL